MKSKLGLCRTHSILRTNFRGLPVYDLRHCVLITPCPARVAMRLNPQSCHKHAFAHITYQWKRHTSVTSGRGTHHLPVEEVWKTGSMRLTHSTALSRNMWSAVSSKAPMRPPTTRMLVSNRLMRRLELHFKLVLTHSLALCFTVQDCHSCWKKDIITFW